MGVVEDLAQARETYEQGEWVAAVETWSRLPSAAVAGEDLHRLATAAFLTGRTEEAHAALQRSYTEHLSAGDPVGAAAAALRVALLMALLGETAMVQGWTARADRLFAEMDEVVVEHGHLEILRFFGSLSAGDVGAADACATRVAELGDRFGDPDLRAFGLNALGRLRLHTGDVPEGLSLLDDAMLGVAAGEVSPVFAGVVYCSMIEACQEVGDLGRAADWTSALSRWCESQPGLIPFTGQCAVHRGQILRQHGAWAEALDEFDRALERYDRQGQTAATGMALAERGDLLRLQGRLDEAETDLGHALERGHEAQPALVLLWLARGRTQAAEAAVRRLFAETNDPVVRTRLLPAGVAVLTSVGDLDGARDLASELDAAAQAFGCRAVLAEAAMAWGLVELESGDASGALPYLRKALRVWGEVEARHQQAHCQVLIGRALSALGDVDSGRSQLEVAHGTFAALGAEPDRRAVAALLEPAGAPGGLSPREVEVLRLVAAGRSNSQIAAELVLSHKTVARHLSNIFTKLDVSSRTAAAAFAFEHGVLGGSGPPGTPP